MAPWELLGWVAAGATSIVILAFAAAIAILLIRSARKAPVRNRKDQP